MPRPIGTIGETKFKILAIIYFNELRGIATYGYDIWRLLKESFHSYLDDGDLRDVYRHLEDLNEAELIKKGAKQATNTAPKRQLYSLTDKGKELKQKFSRYLQILEEEDN